MAVLQDIKEQANIGRYYLVQQKGDYANNGNNPKNFALLTGIYLVIWTFEILILWP